MKHETIININMKYHMMWFLSSKLLAQVKAIDNANASLHTNTFNTHLNVPVVPGYQVARRLLHSISLNHIESSGKTTLI
jgi:hypothetical protein